MKPVPITKDFMAGVESEAAYAHDYWGSRGLDVFELDEPLKAHGHIVWLLTKALLAAVTGDNEKALHHCISTAAACKQWHSKLLERG